MKNLHISASNILGSIISDNIWRFNPVDLTKKGIPKFKLDASYDWVIELKPKSNLMGALFSPFLNPDKMLRVVGVNNCRKKWVRLFTPLERVGFDIDILLVTKKRVDTMNVSYLFSISGVNTSANYDCIIEAEVVDPAKFYTFLSMPGNDTTLRRIICSEISRYIDSILNAGKNIRTRLEGVIDHKLLTEAGYEVRKLELMYRGNSVAA